MASGNHTFRSSHDVDVDEEQDDDLDHELAPGRRTRTLFAREGALGDAAPGRRMLTRFLQRPGEGRALPASLLRGLGNLGDLSDVRVHDDAKTAALVRALGASGLTYGRQ